MRDHEISNEKAVDLYRKAKIGLNLYRTTMDSADRMITHAESLNPRAYELASCGVFSMSTPRAEVAEKFGPLVPTFTTGQELSRLLRHWLAHDAQRVAVAAQLPACVAEDSWLIVDSQLLEQLRDVRSRAA